MCATNMPILRKKEKDNNKRVKVRDLTMSMEMTFRWYGTGHDTVTLKQIKQIRYVTGVITMLYDKMPGELWTQEEIHEAVMLHCV